MKRGTVILFVAMALINIAPAQADQQDFGGEWINTDIDTKGLTRLVISRADNEWRIQAWGKCVPEDCDWKTVKLHVLGSSVSDRSFTYGFAIWEAGFATKYMTLSKDRDQLKVEIVTIFKGDDKYHRANNKYTCHMRRVG